MVNYLTLPDGSRLVVGNLVTIDGYENIRWIVQNGWHSYNNKYYKGWYFSSIPDQEILPENCVDLEKVHLLSTIVDAEDFSVPINTNPSAELTYSGNIEDLLPEAERDSDSEEPEELEYVFRLYNGSLVVLRDDPEVKWIVRYGWYIFDNKQYKGWHFISLKDQSVRPLNPDDFENITLVSIKQNALDQEHPDIVRKFEFDDTEGYDEVLVPIPFGCGNFPIKPGPWPGPHNPLFPPVASDPESVPYYVAQAFITVQNLEERDELKTKKLPHGKLVRVNDVGGNIEYYEWSSTEQKWLHANLLVESRTVTAGDGLSGGGSLEQDITISHGDTGTGEDHTYEVDSDSDTIDVISGISVDKFGHTVGIVERDIAETVIEVAKSVAPRWHVIEADSDSDSDSDS